MEEVFDNILAAKTVTNIVKVDGPIEAAKWDVNNAENLALFQARGRTRGQRRKQRRKKLSLVRAAPGSLVLEAKERLR